MTTETKTKTTTGFRYIYSWKLSKLQKRDLLKAMDYPCKASLHRWLDAPGSMKLDVAEKALAYLQTIFPDVTIKSLTEKR